MSTSCIITPEPSSGATSVTSSDMRTLSSCSSLPATSTHSFQVPGKAPKAMMLPRSASTHGIPSTTKKKTNNNKSGLARQRRNSWMRSSVVRRAAAVVDEEVAALCDKSPFLNSLTDRSNDIALFHRSEIQLGKMLGRGGFAEVYTVSDFSIDSSDITQFFDATEARRRACKAAVTSSSSGRPNYAIKCLRKKLLSNTREFQHAAIDLAVESKYLAALSHRHIIKIRALTKGGSAAFRTGKHDDFFIIMDHLQETLENRLQRWQQRHASPSSGEDADGSTATTTHPLLVAGANPPPQYYQRTLRYAHQIADALNYLHDKSIVYRDLKPSNLGFRERDVIQLFDFGLCRELPKPKGQAAHDEDMEDEETFHMSGVGTQRYMAPEIINTRRYNLKADVYSTSMVILELMTWKKPFAEYTPEEHTKIVAGRGERPRLVTNLNEITASTLTIPLEDDSVAQECLSDLSRSDQSSPQQWLHYQRPKCVLVADWPLGMADLLEEAWTQDVSERLSMKAVFDRLGSIVEQFDNDCSKEKAPRTSTITTHAEQSSPRNHCELDNQRSGWEDREVVLEFPSHFSPRHQLSAGSRQAQEQQSRYSKHLQQHSAPTTRDDSEDRWFCGADRQSDASSSMQELTMTSASTTIHDCNSTSQV